MSRTPRDMGHPSELVRDKKAVMAEIRATRPTSSAIHRLERQSVPGAGRRSRAWRLGADLGLLTWDC